MIKSICYGSEKGFLTKSSEGAVSVANAPKMKGVTYQMNTLMIILTVLLVIAALVVIVSVLLQQGSRQGLGAISGGAETFFGKNKAKSYEGKLALATKIGAAVFIVLSLALAALAS